MQLPIDVKALTDEMSNIGSARNAEISVSVYLDERAPADVIAHVRSLFASTSTTVRMTLSYLNSSFTPSGGDDIAIIVAGASRGIGAAAAAIRAMGVPVAIVTTLPATAMRLAQEKGHDIPDGDLIAPCEGNEDDEPYELTDELARELNKRMSSWIVKACQDKKLAFSAAFPFLRRPMAIDAVQATSLQNAGIGLAPIIPGADLPILTLNQAKMVLQIAATYGVEMNKERVKELAAVVGGAYVCRTVARELAEFVPVLGIAIRPSIAYGGTSAIGYAVIEYFEGGGDAAGLANVVAKATKAAGEFANAVREDPEGVVRDLGSKVKGVASTAYDKLSVFVPKARAFVAEYAPKVRDLAIEYAPKVQQVVKAAMAGAKE